MIEVTEQRLKTLADCLGYACIGSAAYGWHRKSVGLAARHSDHDELHWLKLCAEQVEKAHGREWEGEERAAALQFAFKPRLVAIHERTDAGIKERLVVTTIAPSPVAGAQPWLIRDPDLVTGSYIESLASALRSLQDVQTDRVNTRYDLVRRRVMERWNVSVSEDECVFETIHGDLHWSNLTLPEAFLLDWEGWGRGLAHQDAANLLAFSGLYPGVVAQLRAHFKPLETRVAQVALLFVTAELLRMSDLHGDHPELVPSLQALGSEAKHAWLR